MIEHKFQRNIVPYLLYAFILGVKPNSLDVVFRICYGSIQSIATVTSSHLWFLPCFFLSVLMFNIIEKVNTNSKFNLRFVFIPILIILSLLTSKNYFGDCLSIGWFGGLNSAFTGCILMYFGLVLRWCVELCHFSEYSRLLKLLIGAGLVVCGIVITIPNLHNNVNIAFASYGIFPLFYITVFVMSAGVTVLAMAIDNTFTSYYGKYTLPIYAFHLLIMGVVTIMLKKTGIVINHVLLQGCVLSILTLLVTTIIVIPINKYAPNLVGVFK